MSLAGTLGIGLGLVGTLLECGRSVARRVGEQLLDPIARWSGLRSAPPGRAASTAEVFDDSGDAQARVEEAKYSLGLPERRTTLPPIPPPSPGRDTGDLPRAYGEDRIALMVRDPWWLFAYWELTPTTRVAALRALGADGEGAREVLRVHDVTLITFTGDNAWQSIDVELPPGADSWYVNVSRPAAAYCAEIGLRMASGRFVALARSNTASTPAASPSGDTTVRWARLGEGLPRETAVPWSGQRLPSASAAGVRANGSSERLAGGTAARSSDVHAPLPAR
jgi:hypothetical protein